MARRGAGRHGHDEYRLLAAAAVDGRLDADSAAALEAHLATCAECRADQAAMAADHAWLAAPAAPTWPRAEVRELIVDAARAPRIPRLGNAPRPWGALVAASLVVAVVGTSALLTRNDAFAPGATGSAVPSANETLAAPDVSSIPPDTPFGHAEARLVGNSVGAAPEIAVDAIVIGGNEGAPQGYLRWEDTTGETWTGSITRASYGYDASGLWHVARLEGCKGGGVPPCQLFAAQLIDGRDRSDGQDEISFSWLEPGDDDPEPWSYWFLVVAGDIRVDGPMDVCCYPTPAPGLTYAGLWTTTDCATTPASIVDCSRWGDGSTIRLTIGPGERPEAQYLDDAVDRCGPGGGPGPRVATGTGVFDGPFLWLTFNNVDCPTPSESWASEMSLYLGPTEPTIWFDPDGDEWGLVFRLGDTPTPSG